MTQKFSLTKISKIESLSSLENFSIISSNLIIIKYLENKNRMLNSIF